MGFAWFLFLVWYLMGKSSVYIHFADGSSVIFILLDFNVWIVFSSSISDSIMQWMEMLQSRVPQNQLLNMIWCIEDFQLRLEYAKRTSRHEGCNKFITKIGNFQSRHSANPRWFISNHKIFTDKQYLKIVLTPFTHFEYKAQIESSTLTFNGLKFLLYIYLMQL